MPGLGEDGRQAIQEKHRGDLERFLGRYPWQRVVVFSRAYQSERDFVKKTYPEFRRRLADRVDTLDDFWTTERGEFGSRLHMNVLLTSTNNIPPDLVAGVWKSVSNSRISDYEYDAVKGPGYWVKDMTSFEADSDYGGSVITCDDFPTPRPRRTTKIDHIRARPRRRFRPQAGAEFQQPLQVNGLQTRSVLKWHEKFEALTAARRTRERQSVA